MRPLRLEIEGLRSFRKKVSIEFSDVGLFAIIGDTGAGKSSILEAITYALYNASTWSKGNPKELICTDCEHMSVTFEFEVDADIYTVTRRTSKKGYPAPIHLLEGKEGLRIDGETPVNNEIRRLIGLGWEAFTKTMVLPQGRFSELLHAKPGERTSVLKAILGLEQLDEVKLSLEPYLKKGQVLLADFNGKRSMLPADPAAAIATVSETLQTVSGQRELLEQARTRSRMLSNSIQSAEASMKECRRLLSALGPDIAFADQLATICSTDERLQLELSALQKSLDTNKTKLQDAEQNLHALADNQTDLISLSRYDDVLRRFKRDRNVWHWAVNENNAAFGDIEKQATALADRVRQLPTLQQLATAADEAESAAHTVSDSVKERRMLAGSALQQWQMLDRAVIEARTSSDKAQSEHNQAALDAKENSDAVGDAERAKDEAARALEDARRTNAAAVAAHGLHSGDECPVCTRKLPADFKAPRSPKLDAFVAREGAATARWTEQLNGLALANARYESASRALEQAKQHLTTTQKSAEEALENLSIFGYDRRKDEAASFMARIEREVVQHQTTYDDARVAAQKARQAFSNAKIECESEGRRLDEARKNAANRRLELDQQERTMRDELANIHEDFRVTFDAEPALIDAACKHIATAQTNAREIENERAQAQSAVNAMTLNFTKKRDQIHQEVDLPRQQVVSVIEQRLGALQQIAEFLEEKWGAPKRGRKPYTLEGDIEWGRRAEAEGTALTARLEELASKNGSDARIAREELSTILSERCVSTTDALEDALVQEQSREQQLGAQLRTLRAQEETIRELDVRISELEPFTAAMSTLHRLLGDGRFLKFVVAKREQRLLGIATEILGRMTNDRFGFGEECRIIDRESDQERGPRTLSGGETFLASLALSLALVEIAARAGGRFDSLFLDEGFGSLDMIALDEAMQELERRASGGKTIGVISHIRGVTDYIDTILRVDKSGTGSIVTRLNGPDVEAFAHDEQLNGLLIHHSA